jgi:hypothetical protein
MWELVPSQEEFCFMELVVNLYTHTVPVCFITALITGKEFHVNNMVTPKVSAECLPVGCHL